MNGSSSIKPKAFDKINYVVHETTIEGFKMIMESQKLLTNKTRQKLGLCVKGQGCYKRRLEPSDASLYKDFNRIYEEAYGSYFRVDFDVSCRNHYNNFKFPITGWLDVCLVFSKDLLDQVDWILNTTENNGFYLNSLGMVGESMYGEEGITYDSSNIEKFPPKDIKIFGEWTELVIKDDIDLSCLVEVIFKNKSDYEKYKHLVPKNVSVTYFR